MSAETRAQAFEPFFTTKDVGDSVGLGLSTVYGIVQLNGGTVELMSDHLTGTTVDVYLPRSEASPEREDESALDEDARPMRGGRILLVEDEVSVRQIVQRMREADGHEVITADGGKGALAAARDRVDELDLVITDVVMPGISGPEVIRSLREIRQDLKVLFISGYAGDSDVSSIDSDPYSETLAKPFGGRALAAKVKEMLRG